MIFREHRDSSVARHHADPFAQVSILAGTFTVLVTFSPVYTSFSLPLVLEFDSVSVEFILCALVAVSYHTKKKKKNKTRKTFPPFFEN